MLFEKENLVCSEREIKIQFFIKELMNKFYQADETIVVDKEMLLETLSFLTSSENITSSTKTAVEELHRNVSNMLLQKENEYLKDYIKKLTIEEKK